MAGFFFLIWILDSFIFEFSTGLSAFIPLILRLVICLTLVIVGCGLIFVTGHILFHKENESSKLITTGIFSHVRHPIYLGALILYLGLILFSFSLLSLIFWVSIIIAYDRLATFEEKDLETLFTQEYLAYKKNVPKWFPRVKKHSK